MDTVALYQVLLDDTIRPRVNYQLVERVHLYAVFIESESFCKWTGYTKFQNVQLKRQQ